MKKANVVRLPDKATSRADAKARRTSPEAALGEGLIPGRIIALLDGDAEVELLGGAVVRATPADELVPSFLAECLRARRTVLVARAPQGVLLLGALQTTSQIASSGAETTIRAQRFVVDATEGLVLRVGQTELSLDPRGVVRFAGEKMSVAVAKVFRVLSATAELP